MVDLVFRAFFLVGFLILAVFQIRQIKAIKLFHRLPKSYIYPALLIIVFGSMAYTLGETWFDYLFFLIPVLTILLSLYNKGFTEESVLPPTTGMPLNNLLSVSIPLNQTKDWLVIEQKRRLKVRFISTYKSNLPTVYSIAFEKEKIDDIEAHLLRYGLSLDFQNYRNGY